MATPELVSSFRFVTPENIVESSTSHRKSARDVDLEVQAGLKHWEGRSIFSTTT